MSLSAREAGPEAADRDPDVDPEFDLGAGAPEPDPSLGAFLERVALVADSDQIPTQAGEDARAWSP